jgi:uncharacterized spore protein YtfJ
MITSDQKTEGCIALNKLKLLISEAACIYDLKSLYTAIETAIATGAAGGGGAAGDTSASGGATSTPPSGGAGAGASSTDISVTWLETKIAELKNEIELTLTEITNQIQNNI